MNLKNPSASKAGTVSVLHKTQSIPCLRICILEEEYKCWDIALRLVSSIFPSKGRIRCSQVCKEVPDFVLVGVTS